MAETQKVNKSAFVRNVLKDIGALTNDPPEGWRQKVEAALEKEKLDMHQVTIYQIRQKAMRANGVDAPKLNGKPAKPKVVRAKVVPIVEEKKSSIDNLAVKDLIAVQEFSKKFGGLDGLAEVVGFIKSLKV